MVIGVTLQSSCKLACASIGDSRTAGPKGDTAVSYHWLELEARGIVVRCPSDRGLAEEAPFAYKDVERVVAVVERAGLARRVAQLVPLGVVKG